MLTAEDFNQRGAGKLPGHLGLVVTQISAEQVCAVLAVTEKVMAPNGFLHAGTVLTLADTCAGYGCVVNLPPGATGFTTVEIKSNHLGTALNGSITCVATPLHLGKSTQVWDAVVSHRETGKTIAVYRCTQMILYAKAAA